MSGFQKSDDGKVMMGAIPPRALMAVARVLTSGARKYGRDNWHQVPARSRYYDAAQRHLVAWWSGEDKDPDTQESHLAHAVCCLMFLLELEQVSPGAAPVEDDRMTILRMVAARGVEDVRTWTPGPVAAPGVLAEQGGPSIQKLGRGLASAAAAVHVVHAAAAYAAGLKPDTSRTSELERKGKRRAR